MGNHKVEFHREAQTMKPILTGRERRKTQEITGKMSEGGGRVIQVEKQEQDQEQEQEMNAYRHVWW